VTDALQHGVHAESCAEFPHALDGLLAALGDHVGGAELARERNPVGVAAHDDDLLRAEALGGDHAAQADGTVSDDSRGLPRADFGGDGPMLARAHHVGKGEK
jgi:hypothetical protein